MAFKELLKDALVSKCLEIIHNGPFEGGKSCAPASFDNKIMFPDIPVLLLVRNVLSP